MKIIVGLGNPGSKYLLTRHNLGFMLIDRLAEEQSFQKKHSSLILKMKNTLLVKPQTFMNLSGQAVQQVMSFYKAEFEDLIVVHDDKDLDFGMIRFQKNRGHGGHNGIRNIHQVLKTQDYCRLKLGVFSKLSTSNSSENTTNILDYDPIDPYKLHNPSTVDLVLSPFNKEEQNQIPQFLDKAESALHCWLKEGYQKASNQFNCNESI